jgi:diguanylate cyclase (GGDEF)-like protein
MKLPSSVRRLRDRLSIRQQSAALTVLLSLATVAVMTLGTATVVRHHALDAANGELRLLAQTMASRLDRQMFERHREIVNLANLAPLTDVWRDRPGEIGTFLDQMQDSLPSYAWIGYAAADGTVRAATRRMLEGASVAARPWFIEGLKGPTVQDVHEAKLLAKLVPQAEGDDPFRLVDVAAPVRDRSGRVMGVVGAHLSWAWARDIRRQLLARLDPALQTDLWVTSADGTIVLGPAETAPVLTPEQLMATAGGGAADEGLDISDGQALVAAVGTRGFDTYEGLGWRVVARRPMTIALVDANETILTIFLIGLAAAVASSLAAALIAGRVMRPLSLLADNADRIGRDPTMALIDRQSGSLDIIRLSNSLRSLVRRIDFAESHLSEALAKAGRSEQAITQLRRLAETDPMTGLLNRRGFRGFAAEAHAASQRHERRFGVMMIDIDHFKAINDTFGHAAGDAVITELATIVSKSLRAGDRIARFGGEEFVVFLLDVDETGVAVWGERIRRRIEESPTFWEGQALKVTVSVGTTLVTRDDRDIEDVIHRADVALYAAKSDGRNRVSFRAPLSAPAQTA